MTKQISLLGGIGEANDVDAYVLARELERFLESGKWSREYYVRVNGRRGAESEWHILEVRLEHEREGVVFLLLISEGKGWVSSRESQYPVLCQRCRSVLEERLGAIDWGQMYWKIKGEGTTMITNEVLRGVVQEMQNVGYRYLGLHTAGGIVMRFRKAGGAKEFWVRIRDFVAEGGEDESDRLADGADLTINPEELLELPAKVRRFIGEGGE